MAISLEDSIVNFAKAAASAQDALAQDNHPLMLSLYEFQFSTTTDTKVGLNLSAQLSGGDESDKFSVTGSASAARDSTVGLMIHCVMQNPRLAQNFAAQSAQVQGMNLTSNAILPSGGGASGGASGGGDGGDGGGNPGV
ncbi:hypothetical protein JHL17_36030 [Azospirillum sp. YIM B02556]|uniref:Uncharacterized protein n=1 Tax=Azospirillum endophyticum TaxID=2800326 RepID=A0ABS1FHB4_9PROT|nr:hypothetical protein [Azospirillum endophyticum]MBK1842816.1 hypothetical protein [Azospirillum endophyticum]